MRIFYETGHLHADASGYTAFSGTYIANLPYFVFSYDYFINPEPESRKPFSFTIEVNDITTLTNLFSYTINEGEVSEESGAYYIPTPVGDNISVEFKLTLGHGGSDTYGGRSSYVNYNMTTVVPEPLSSILFITGGALLAGRLYIKRKKRA
jgi:hypothetical protein